MTESISYTGLVIAILLPWLLGSLLTYRLITQAGQWTWPSIIGQGYLLGIFLTTIILRVWDGAGLKLNFWPIAGLLLSLTIILFALQLMRPKPPSSKLAFSRLENWQAVLVIVLMGLVAWRYFTILQEILDKPLYAWDAWMNWAPKAIVWFHHAELVSYVSPEDWLVLSTDEQAHTLGNWRAWQYPKTVPLIQLWTMMGLQSYDNNLIYLPWILVAISLGLTMYGQLRSNGVSALRATIACYLMLNLPYANAHTILYGYADIWVIAAFGMAVFSLYNWRATRHKSHAVLIIIFALMASQLKLPGIILGFIIFVVFLRSLFNFQYKSELFTVALAGGAVLAIAWLGIDFEIPGLGRILVSEGFIKIPVIGTVSLHYQDVSQAFIESFFLMLNWNMLWYALLAFLGIAIVEKRFLKPPSDTLCILMLVSLFLTFVFTFTNYSATAINHTTLNRALFYLAPVVIFYITCQHHEHRISKRTHSLITS
jgi:hypothetical protein